MGELSQAQAKVHMAYALKSPEIRDVCAALQLLHASVLMLDTLPPTSLEVLRDHVFSQWRDRVGPMGEFKRCYADLVDSKLREAVAAERQEIHGLPALGEFEFQSRR
jgi:hypothetical protein